MYTEKLSKFHNFKKRAEGKTEKQLKPFLRDGKTSTFVPATDPDPVVFRND